MFAKTLPLCAALIIAAAPLAAEEQPPLVPVDAVGAAEEEGEVANRLDRDAPTLYDKNKWDIERQQRREARRAWREQQRVPQPQQGEEFPQPAESQPAER